MLIYSRVCGSNVNVNNDEIKVMWPGMTKYGSENVFIGVLYGVREESGQL
jgi:hypothetical protein